jgi:hypothetical protein
MTIGEDEFVVLRQRILGLKDEVYALTLDVASLDVEAARSMTRARAALFEAWTLLVGPPEEDEEDH